MFFRATKWRTQQKSEAVFFIFYILIRHQRNEMNGTSQIFASDSTIDAELNLRICRIESSLIQIKIWILYAIIAILVILLIVK